MPIFPKANPPLSSPKKRIVIVGGSGFIGQALTQYFQNNPAVQLTSLSHLDIDLVKENASEQLSHLLDFSTNLILAFRPRVKEGALALHRKMIHTVSRALEHQKVRQCLLMSSTSIYGNVKDPTAIRETDPSEPAQDYGQAKAEEEKRMLEVCRKMVIPISILRVPMILGPGADLEPYGPAKFIVSLLKDGTLQFFGDGTEKRQYLDRKDLAVITDYFIESPYPGTFNISSEYGYSFAELVQKLRDISQVPIQVKELPRNRPQSDWILDTRLFKALFPQFSFTPIEETLREMVSYARLNPSQSRMPSVK